MPKFSKISQERLDTCNLDLRRLFEYVINKYDCSILEGNRNKEKQDELFEQGKSKLKFPESKHNFRISRAVDVAPYPVDFSNVPKNINRYYHFAGYVLSSARILGIVIRWGGDWDRDKQFDDQTFDDLVHFELS